MAKRFIILDGSSLFFRAFYAIRSLTDAKGRPTNAVFGFSNMLTKIVKDLNPDLMALAFDKSRTTFRTKRYAAYKGTRDKTPEDLLFQIPLLREYTECFGIPFLECDNYEADDIIGTLATQAAEKGRDVIVITGDRDALQLIRPNLRVFLTMKGITELAEYDEDVFQAEYGMEPIRLIDLKGLMGDTSDNIPGIRGVGPKTALKLLHAYGTLEAVLEHAGEVSGKKLRESLIAERDIALLSKELATIDLAVPGFSFQEEDFIVKPHVDKMQSFCKSYELNRPWQSFASLFSVETKGRDANSVNTIDLSYTDFEKGNLVKLKEAVALGATFSGKAPFERLEGLAITSEDGTTRFLSRENAAFAEALAALERVKTVIVLDAKLFCHTSVDFKGKLYDAKLCTYLLHPEDAHYEMAEIVHRFLPADNVPESVSEKEFAVWQAKILAKLLPIYQAALDKEELAKLYETIERPLIPVLSDMEQNGVYVNRKSLEEKSVEVCGKISALQDEIYALAGHEFNINSTKQIGAVLFDELGLPPVKKTKTGYSTNAEVLEKLRSHHSIVDKILSYRMWTKLKSTYLDGISFLIDEESGRVHTTFNQTVTATGRLSSSDPNLQNIPVRTEEGRTIRGLFEPGEGYDAILSADYSQIELRVLAHMSGDENFIDAFQKAQDIHARTASEVFDVPLEEVTSELRRRAKAVNFGIVYGISDFGLGKNLGISRREAGAYIATYFERYPGIRAFMDAMVESAHKRGYVTTMFGRRRYLPAISSRNFTQRSLAERMAMNTPIQGTAADIIKLAMIRTESALKAAGLKSRVLLQVHDELVLEITNEERAEVEAILKEAMEHVVDLSVPLVVDINSGKNWAEAK